MLTDHTMIFTVVLATILFAITFPPMDGDHFANALTSPWQISRSTVRTKSLQGLFSSRELLTSKCLEFSRCNDVGNDSNAAEKSSLTAKRYAWNWASRLWSTGRLELSRRVWRLLRIFARHLRRYWKKNFSPVSLRQLREAQKFTRSKVCNFLVASTMYWNVFFGNLPTAPPHLCQTHIIPLSKSPVSVLTKAQFRAPTLNVASTRSNTRNLVSGHSIEIEKERKVRWQQRQQKEFRWDTCPEDGYLGLGYPNSPRFIVSQISDHSKEMSSLEELKS
jgi:hypothetical protein